ncbi:hypothetical protein BH23ACT9_BH23ACT9_07710 [soil metagenome]
MAATSVARLQRLVPPAGLVALVAVVWLLAGGRAGQAVEVLDVPPEDHVEARLLTDGTPVWVTSDGVAVTVLEALTPSRGVVGGITGWCALGGRFVDPHLGVSFGPDGARYAGIVPGRMHRDQDLRVGLTPRPVLLTDDVHPGAPLRVLSAAAPADGAIRPPLGSVRGLGPPAACRLPLDRERRLDATVGTGLSGHGHLASRLDPGRGGWQIADGWIEVQPDGSTRWCEGPMAPPPDDTADFCDDRRGVPVHLPLGEGEAGGVVTAIGAPLAVRVTNGAVTDVAVLPSSSWHGSSLSGTRRHVLTLTGIDVDGGRLVVRHQRDLPCIGPAPRGLGSPVGSDVVYVGPDPVLRVGGDGIADLAGAAERTGLADPTGRPDPGDLRDVEVVVDDVTCRALSVTTG